MSKYPWLKATYERIHQDVVAERLAHAVLLTSSEGIGVSEFADEVAAYRLCFNATSQAAEGACGQCKACSLLSSGTHPDLKVLEPEGAAQIIKVDQVRELVSFMSQTPQIGEWKVAVIKPAHRMNQNAANALLKVLEEPPGQSLLLLATERPQMLLPTVRSRCAHISLPSPNQSQTMDYLASAGIDSASASEAVDRLGFKPLLIAEWINTDLMGSWKLVTTEIEALETGRSSAVNTAMAIKDIEIGQLVGWLAENAAAKMKNSLMLNAKEQESLEIFDRYERIYQRLLETRQILDSGSNPNAQLALESIFLDWPRVA